MGRAPAAVVTSYLSIWLAAAAGALHLAPALAGRLAYDRAAIAGGELWRVVTGHWTHWSVDHLAWDVVAFAVLGLAVERMDRRGFVACIGGAALAVAGTVWWLQPGLTTYRGLSGLDSALFVWLAAHLALSDGPMTVRTAAATALLAFAGKIGYEAVTGATIFVQGAPGVVGVPLAHVAGGAIGVTLGAWPALRHGLARQGRPAT